MKKKYFTEEEKKNARKLESKKYYAKIKKTPLSDEEKEKLKKEREQKRAEYIKEYYIKNKEKIKEYGKEYFKNNKETKQRKNNENYKKRRDSDPIFRLSTNIRRNIRGLITKNGHTKKSKTIEILGCSFEEFKEYLESKFESWMTWDNYGLYNGELNYGWDIDHIIPSCNGITEEKLLKLNHFSNLQPLCSYINRVVKRDNVVTVSKPGNVSKITIK